MSFNVTCLQTVNILCQARLTAKCGFDSIHHNPSYLQEEVTPAQRVTYALCTRRAHEKHRDN